MRQLAADTVGLIGKEILLSGWVNSRRDHGKIMFVDLRDRSGIVQLVSNKSLGDVRPEDVIEVRGTVKARPESMVNPKIPSGTVEVEVTTIRTLSKAREMPFPLDSAGYEVKEELRLKYRYLDLRRERLQKNIRLRSVFVDRIRQFLFGAGFAEIETPLLTKSTPEGSRDFLVPARLQPGKFYALPQSPQQYKQLLMVAGFERYFQIARCMRDEDLRADRGFEHTQVDLEMSFVDREDVMRLDEEMMISVTESLGYRLKDKPFPRFSYAEAMKRFGADKFDLRTEAEKKAGVLAFCWVVDFPFFEKTDEGGWTFTHNPFSAPKTEHRDWLLGKEHIGEILTTQYDLVCNGYEVGGGSIRSHEADVLSAVFEVMGYPRERIRSDFGHMLEAFTYGVPPHGGLAHGIERLLMTITGEPYLREVVAFPMTSGGQTSVMDAPSSVSAEQLEELGIAVTVKRKNPEDVYRGILALFSAAKIPVTPYEHEPVHTSEEAARVRGTPLSAGAKALVLVADDKSVMVVLPGDRKLDTKEFKHAFGVKDLRMATPEEVLSITGVPIGAVPPFGHLFDIPLYMDARLRENERIVFNAGYHTKSIEVRQQDYEAGTKPIVGAFSR